MYRRSVFWGFLVIGTDPTPSKEFHRGCSLTSGLKGGYYYVVFAWRFETGKWIVNVYLVCVTRSDSAPGFSSLYTHGAFKEHHPDWVPESGFLLWERQVQQQEETEKSRYRDAEWLQVSAAAVLMCTPLMSLMDVRLTICVNTHVCYGCFLYSLNVKTPEWGGNI